MLNKNTPLETVKGLQRVHLELTKCCLSIDTFFLSCSVAQFVDIVKLHSPWTGTSALSATLMRYYAVYQFSYVICRTRDSVFHHISNTEKRADKTILWKVFLTIVDILWWNTVLRVRSNFLLILGVKTCKTHEWRKTVNTKKSLRSQYEPKKIIARKQRKIHKFLHRGWP